MDRIDQIITQWNRERPDLDVGPMALIGRIKRLNQHLSNDMEKTFAEFGLNRATFDVLATLRRSGPPYSLTPGELLASAMVTSGTMTNRIDQLEKADLVERARNPNDGRGMVISLTTQGFKLIDAAVSAHVKTQTGLVSCLGIEEREILERLLAKYLGHFESV